MLVALPIFAFALPLISGQYHSLYFEELEFFQNDPNELFTRRLSFSEMELSNITRRLGNGPSRSEFNGLRSRVEELESEHARLLEENLELQRSSITETLKALLARVKVVGDTFGKVTMNLKFDGSRSSSMMVKLFNQRKIPAIKKFVEHCLDSGDGKELNLGFPAIQFHLGGEINWSDCTTEFSEEERTQIDEIVHKTIQNSDTTSTLKLEVWFVTDYLSSLALEVSMVYFESDVAGHQQKLMNDFHNILEQPQTSEYHEQLMRNPDDVSPEVRKYIMDGRESKLCFVALVEGNTNMCVGKTMIQEDDQISMIEGEKHTITTRKNNRITSKQTPKEPSFVELQQKFIEMDDDEEW